MHRKTTDWSVSFGTGIEYDAGFVSLTLDLRYGLGLREVGTVPGLKNRGGTVTLGWMRPIGR